MNTCQRKYALLGVLAITLSILVSVTAFAGNGNSASQGDSCWGQASAVFAQMGEMGEHSSSFPTPRLGIRNLARQLYYAGIIPDDSMASLGVFVADELGLDIYACY